MPPQFVPGGLPGIDAQVPGETYQIWFGRSDQQIISRALLSSATRDAGNSPTTILRGGLVLAQLTASGKYVAYSATGANGAGSERARCILEQGTNILDPTGTAVDKKLPALFGGLIKADQCVNLDHQARKALRANGPFVFDDEMHEQAAQQSGGLFVPRGILLYSNYQAANVMTLTAAMSGCLIICDGGAAQGITLPTLAKGLIFDLYNVVDQNLTITGASNSIVKTNSTGATTVAFSTSSEKIGASCRVMANPAADRWLFSNFSANTAT